MKHCYGICNGAIIYRLLWNIPQNLEDRSSCSQMFFKTGVLNNFAIFTGKHLCWSLFMIKLKAWRPTTILKTMTVKQVFFCESSLELFFYRTPLVAAFERKTPVSKHFFLPSLKLQPETLLKDSSRLFFWGFLQSFSEHPFCKTPSDNCLSYFSFPSTYFH